MEISTGKITYYSLEDVPIEKYLEVYLIRIPLDLLKNDLFISKFKHFINIESIYFLSNSDTKWWDFNDDLLTLQFINNLPNEFACMQNLSHISADFRYLDKNKIYIYENKMTVLFQDLAFEIPPFVKYLNIIYTASPWNESDFINLPNTLEHMRLSTSSIEEFKQTNLPSGLKSLSVSILHIHEYLEADVIDIINSNCKIPHECKLIINL
jgi:hypothetical protein